MESTHAAHSVFATFCTLNVPACPSSTRITPAPGSRPIVACPQQVSWPMQKVPVMGAVVLIVIASSDMDDPRGDSTPTAALG